MSRKRRQARDFIARRLGGKPHCKRCGGAILATPVIEDDGTWCQVCHMRAALERLAATEPIRGEDGILRIPSRDWQRHFVEAELASYIREWYGGARKSPYRVKTVTMKPKRKGQGMARRLWLALPSERRHLHRKGAAA